MKNSFKISRIQRNDVGRFMELIALMNQVFEEPNRVASEKQLKALLNKPDFHAFVATRGGKVIGGLTAYEMKGYYTDKSELYIYDIAVTTELQKQGIGKELISYLKDYSTNHGIETIFVEAHSEDKQAVGFYKSVFGKSEKVDHFNFEIV